MRRSPIDIDIDVLGSLPTGGTLRPEEDNVAVADGGQVSDDLIGLLFDNREALLRATVTAVAIMTAIGVAFLAKRAFAYVYVELGMTAAQVAVIGGDVGLSPVGANGLVLGIGAAAAACHQQRQESQQSQHADDGTG